MKMGELANSSLPDREGDAKMPPQIKHRCFMQKSHLLKEETGSENIIISPIVSTKLNSTAQLFLQLKKAPAC